MRMALAEAARMAGALLPAGASGEAMVEGYTIDSRQARPGELFFAIAGPQRDGHQFLGEALAAGAVAAVASRAPLVCAGRILLARDPRAALQRLATEARVRWGGRVAAVTGSNGKTTTKEILAALLGTRYRVAKTEGNLNNELGLPLSLLRMPEETEVGVVELGMNHAGEIRALAAMAAPGVGVVTNVNPAHLEFFGSLEGIALAKRELIEGLPADGIAVLNADDPRVRAFAAVHRGRVLTYGLEQKADIRAVAVVELGLEGTRFQLADPVVEFHTPLAGRHNLYNTLAGIAGAVALGLRPEALVQAVARLAPAPMRGEIWEAGGIGVINDCYNSNPRAVETMIDLLASAPARRRVVVLGEMLELGPGGEELHRQVGRRVAQAKVDLLAGVGAGAKFLVQAALEEGFSARAAHFFGDAEAAGLFLRNALAPGDVVLFKGSRGVRLERALELALGRPGRPAGAS